MVSTDKTKARALLLALSLAATVFSVACVTEAQTRPSGVAEPSAASPSGQGYVFNFKDFPPLRQAVSLSMTPSVRSNYNWLTGDDDGGGRVTIHAHCRANPSSPLVSDSLVVDLAENITAIGEVYPHKLYVCTVNSHGQTSIQRWDISIRLSPAGQINISAPKTTVIPATAELTHLRSLAVSEDESYLLAHHMEDEKIIRIDLPSGAVTTILDNAAQPDLEEYTILFWRKHVTHGQVFFGVKMDRVSYDSDSTLLLWDPAKDGHFETIEVIDQATWNMRGYEDLQLWEPEKSLVGRR